MNQSDFRNLAFVLFTLSIVGSASAEVAFEEGTVVSPDNSNTDYVMAQNISFSQVEVFDDRVNFSHTNVSTDANPGSGVDIWSHNFSRNGENAHYSYNLSADTSFHQIDPNLYYEVFFNGSSERVVTEQKYLNVSVPAGTNLTVESFENTPPSYSAFSPSNNSEAVSTSPTLSIDVSDQESDQLDVRYYDGNGDLIGEDTGVSSGSTSSIEWNNLNSGTQYSWHVEVDDGATTAESGARRFTTNYPPGLAPDQQYYSNFTTNHQFEVEAYASDDDGESDFETCKVNYQTSDSSGTVDSDPDPSYGTDNEVSCTANLSTSLSGVKVGEGVTTSVSFYDGQSWVNTSEGSNAVPNSAPTAPTSYTELGSYVTDHTPSIQWLGEDDSDGDNMTMQAYLSENASPENLDNEVDSESSGMEIGQTVQLEDSGTYYYRLRACDEYGKCSNYAQDVEFTMNSLPNITGHSANSTNVDLNDTINIEADVEDEKVQSVNFTVWEGDTKLVDSENGSVIAGDTNSGTWKSPDFTVDENAIYNYTIEATDNASESSIENGEVSLTFLENGHYVETHTTSGTARNVKMELHGDLNGQNVGVKVNTTGSDPESIPNGTWQNIEDGQDITVNLTFEGSGKQTPEIRGYDLSYRTDYETSGYMLTEVHDFGEEATIGEVDILQDVPEETSTTYEFRTGSSEDTSSGWTDWVTCTGDCEPAVEDNRYIQYRANLTGTASETPVVKTVDVTYQ